MKIQYKFTSKCLASILLAGLAGMEGAPAYGAILGLPSTENQSYAQWNSFTDPNATSLAAQASDTSAFTATLSYAASNGLAGASVSNEIYTSTGTFSGEIDGTTTAPVNELVLAIKFTTPYAPSGATFENYFTLTLDGLAPASVQDLGMTGEMTFGQPLGVMSYAWTNLGLDSGSNFVIAFNAPATGAHDAVNAFQVETPEPASLAMLALGALSLLRRRRIAA